MGAPRRNIEQGVGWGQDKYRYAERSVPYAGGEVPGCKEWQMSELESLRDELRRFAAERDWEQFHSPKNLAAALAVEAAELLEPFQWLTEEQSRNLTPTQAAAVQGELADVFIYLVRLSDKLGVDLLGAAQEKLIRNAEKYPIEKSRGSALKYTDF